MITKTKFIYEQDIDTTSLPFIRHIGPDDIFISYANARTTSTEIFVKPEDKVKVGTVVGKRIGSFTGGTYEQNIHSTVSGTVVGTVKKFHRSGKLVDFLHIKNDKEETLDESIKERSDKAIAKLTKKDIINIIKECSLVGLGGSAFPTYIKFQTTEKINTLVINAVECEPYLSTDYKAAIDATHELLSGIKIAMQAFEANNVFIAVKKKNQNLIKHLNSALSKEPIAGVKVKAVGNHYPSGYELETIHQTTGVKIVRGTLPTTKGILSFNSTTMIGLYYAVKYNKPISERYVTVSGNGIAKPHNFYTKIGTSINELIKLSHGYTEGNEKVIVLGGPMMGSAALKEDAVLSKTCTSVLVFNAVKHKEEPCVRCASCVYSCPVGIKPVEIMYATANRDSEKLAKLDVHRCMECGLCSYTCTSKIHLTEFVRRSKRMVK